MLRNIAVSVVTLEPMAGSPILLFKATCVCFAWVRPKVDL